MKPDRRQVYGGRIHPRRSNLRPKIPRILIVCEGEKTEPEYFKAFEILPELCKIVTIGTGLNTVNLVIEAHKRKTEAKKNDLPYHQVWCVFDVEDFPAQAVNKAISLARKYGIRLAVSNQAFELWYLLHFHYHDSAIDRQQYVDKLSAELKYKYEKNVCIYDQLVDRQETALKNACRLLEQYKPYDPAHNDPSTTVHLLVEELNRFTPEARARQRKLHD